jgi:protein-tyrosine phosphatase
MNRYTPPGRYLPAALLAFGAVLLLPSAHAAISGATVERTASRALQLHWQSARPVDVYVAARPDAPLREAQLVSKGDADGTHLYEPKDAASRSYFLLREQGSNGLTTVAERVVPLERGSNFRDVGGYVTESGKQIRWGRLYRSGGSPLLTEADVAKVKSAGVVDLIDLRSSEERVLAPTKLEGLRYQAVGYSMLTMMGNAAADPDVGAIYRQFPTLLAPQLKLLFQALLNDEGAVAVNCSAGQDRTGFATAMVLSTLGVPRATVYEDYHLSTRYRVPANEMPSLDAAAAAGNPIAQYFARMQKDPRAAVAQPLYDAEHHALLERAFDEIDKRWGSVDAYLQAEVGLSKQDLQRLRARLLQ